MPAARASSPYVRPAIAQPCSRRPTVAQAAAAELRDAPVKLEKQGQDYIPRKDTCIKAFVRLLAAQNASA